MQFKIEQIALAPTNTIRAKRLLQLIGLTEWVDDHVVASGTVFAERGTNEANLSFNYQATSDKALELELLAYTNGPNWLQRRPAGIVSHIGMHCTALELEGWKTLLAAEGILIAQTVMTESHTNAYIATSRRYNYVIFDTNEILGVDLKFIVRYNAE